MVLLNKTAFSGSLELLPENKEEKSTKSHSLFKNIQNSYNLLAISFKNVADHCAEKSYTKIS